MDKRTFLKTSLLAGAGALIARPAFSFGTNSETQNEFKQVELPYSFDALEPHIDAMTMELHYTKHHAGYTSKFNAALKEAGIEEDNIKKIFANISKYSMAVRNNGGGFYNHNLFWKVMSPDGGGKPKGALMKEIKGQFGSFEQFTEKFSQAAGTVFGSGWAWLVDNDGQLEIRQTPNQDNPLMDVSGKIANPLLAIDVWEHAYYLNYKNMRTAYISAFFNVINWDYVAKRLEKSRS